MVSNPRNYSDLEDLECPQCHREGAKRKASRCTACGAYVFFRLEPLLAPIPKIPIWYQLQDGTWRRLGK